MRRAGNFTTTKKPTKAAGIKPVEPLGIGIYGAVFHENKHYRKGMKVRITPTSGQEGPKEGVIHKITDVEISLLVEKEPMKKYPFREISSITLARKPR